MKLSPPSANTALWEHLRMMNPKHVSLARPGHTQKEKQKENQPYLLARDVFLGNTVIFQTVRIRLRSTLNVSLAKKEKLNSQCH